MALPVAPLALTLARYGALLGVAYLVGRRGGLVARDAHAEMAFDDTPEGMALRSDPDGFRATARWRRVFRVQGEALDIDAAVLARLRVRKA